MPDCQAGGGNEGGDTGGNGDDAPFVSSGAVHGAFDSVEEALTLAYDETFAGLLGDTEIAATFDETSETFIGRRRGFRCVNLGGGEKRRG